MAKNIWKMVFLKPSIRGSKGKMLTGWQWIDGKCYYLSHETTSNYPLGSMYQDTVTPDGYLVELSGAWTNGNGTVQYEAGKGIQTTSAASKKTTRFYSGGSSSGGFQSGTKTSSRENQEETLGEEDIVESSIPSDAQQAEDQDEVQESELLGYTIKYMDIENKAVLKLVTGKDVKNAEIVIDDQDIDGYEICNDQKEQFHLVTDKMTVNIYYSKIESASPSEAQKVSWKLYFVEQDNHGNEIFKSQSGQTEEDTELFVDFPETILGTDNYYY